MVGKAHARLPDEKRGAQTGNTNLLAARENQTPSSGSAFTYFKEAAPCDRGIQILMASEPDTLKGAESGFARGNTFAQDHDKLADASKARNPTGEAASSAH